MEARLTIVNAAAHVQGAVRVQGQEPLVADGAEEPRAERAGRHDRSFIRVLVSLWTTGPGLVMACLRGEVLLVALCDQMPVNRTEQPPIRPVKIYLKKERNFI